MLNMSGAKDTFSVSDCLERSNMRSYRVLACNKCKQYMMIHPDNRVSQKQVESFKELHDGHALFTINRNEIKEMYDFHKV